MKKLKMMLAVCFIMIILAGCTAEKIDIKLSANPPKTSVTQYTGSVESEHFTLSCDAQTGDIALFDKRTKQSYFGIPPEADDDPVKGLFKFELKSQLVIRGINTLTEQITDINSFTSSASKKTVKVEQLDSGFKVTYVFEKEKLTVPVYFLIKNNTFRVYINADEIVEAENIFIREIEILPNFGAASNQENGFIFVPDGSGAVMEFNRPKSIKGKYKGKIYGWDDSFYLKQKFAVSQDIKLPIFGIEKNGSGFLAVLEKADAAGNIIATTNGFTTYGGACFSVTLHTADLVYLNKNKAHEKSVLKYNLDNEVAEIDIKYTFYDEKDGGISAMADIYREQLLKEKSLEDEHDIYLQIYSTIDIDKSVLGIPQRTVKKLTSFSETIDILDELSATGINSVGINLMHTDKNMLLNKKTDKYKPIGTAGSQKDFKALLDRAGSSVFPNVEINLLTGMGSVLSGVKEISHEPAYSYHYDLATYGIDTEARNMVLQKPADASLAVKQVSKSLGKFTENLSLGGYGIRLYSDFDKNQTTARQQALELINQTYESLGEHSILSNSPNKYAIIYSDYIVSAPSASSKEDLFDYEVPFYALVLNGKTDYAFEPWNLAPDRELYKLKLLQTDAKPYYTVFYEDGSAIKHTKYDTLYACNFDSEKEFIKTSFKAVTDFRNRYGKVKSFAFYDGINVVTYEKGTVLFNLTSQPLRYNGIEVPARSYIAG